MARETQGVAPGWYKDPADPTTQRWWDGEGWIGDPLPADATPPPGPPPPSAHPVPGPHQLATAAKPIPPVGGGGVPHPEVIPPPSVTPIGPPADAIPPGHPTATPTRPGRGDPPPRPHGAPLATLGARLVARLIDIGLVFLLNVVVNGWFVYQYVREISPIVAETQRRLLANEPLDDLPDSSEAQTLLIVILIIAAALWFAYEVPAVANTGQTPGKRLAGIRVVRVESTNPLGFGRSFRRWNTMGLPTLLWWCFGIGFLLQLVDALYTLFDRPLQQALHDKSAQTVVVATRSRPPAREEAPDAPADPS